MTYQWKNNCTIKPLKLLSFSCGCWVEHIIYPFLPIYLKYLILFGSLFTYSFLSRILLLIPSLYIYRHIPLIPSHSYTLASVSVSFTLGTFILPWTLGWSGIRKYTKYNQIKSNQIRRCAVNMLFPEWATTGWSTHTINRPSISVYFLV